MSGADVVMIVSLKSGLAPFTRRDVAAMVEGGMDVLLVPTKVSKGVDAEGLPSPVLGHSMAARARGIAHGLLRAFAHPAVLARLVRVAVKHRQLLSLGVALQAYSSCPRTRLVYAVFGDRKLFAGYFLSRLTGAPLAVTIHAYELHNNPCPELFLEALDAASVVMTVTEANRELLDSRWGGRGARAEVVRVSVDAIAFDGDERFVVLMVGTWSSIKGHTDLLDACRIMNAPNVELWIVGRPGGTHQVDVRREARTRGVEASCVFFGQLPESAVAALMRRADVLVQPSRRDEDGAMEGFPTSVAEAMYSGLPVIVTDHAEMPRVVESIVVPERDPVALAEALARYRDDPALRQRDGERNRETAERLFGESAHDALLRVLRGAMRDA